MLKWVCPLHLFKLWKKCFWLKLKKFNQKHFLVDCGPRQILAHLLQNIFFHNLYFWFLCNRCPGGTAVRSSIAIVYAQLHVGILFQSKFVNMCWIVTRIVFVKYFPIVWSRWAHPKSFRHRVHCWHACSDDVQQNMHVPNVFKCASNSTIVNVLFPFWQVLWRGSEAFGPYLRELFDDAHDRSRSSWLEKGLPEHFDKVHYYWIAK